MLLHVMRTLSGHNQDSKTLISNRLDYYHNEPNVIVRMMTNTYYIKINQLFMSFIWCSLDEWDVNIALWLLDCVRETTFLWWGTLRTFEVIKHHQRPCECIEKYRKMGLRMQIWNVALFTSPYVFANGQDLLWTVKITRRWLSSGFVVTCSLSMLLKGTENQVRGGTCLNFGPRRIRVLSQTDHWNAISLNIVFIVTFMTPMCFWSRDFVR